MQFIHRFVEDLKISVFYCTCILTPLVGLCLFLHSIAYIGVEALGWLFK